MCYVLALVLPIREILMYKTYSVPNDMEHASVP